MYHLTSTVILLLLSSLVAGQEHNLDAASQTLEGANKFAVKLYQILTDGAEGNVFFSPVSVDVVLAMAYIGANGATAFELAEALNVPNNKSLVGAGYRTVMNNLKERKREVTLELANKLYVDVKGQVKSEYVEKIQDVFKADVGTGDFKNNTKAAVNDINAWANQVTHGKISNIISEDEETKNAVLLALNAVYFYGKWLYIFNNGSTQKENFYLNADSTVEATMMHQEAHFLYGEFDDFRVLKMMYKGKDMSMMVLLPSERDGLPKIESKIHDLNFTEIDGKLWTRKVRVTFPKFKLQTTMKLKPVLEKMGLSNIFNITADFSGISTKDLYINKIIQKAFVEVTEEGTEAVAITATYFLPRPAPPDFPVNFIADHPFLFTIQDEISKVILFMGRFAKP